VGNIQCIASALLNVQRLVEYAVDFTDRYMKKMKKYIYDNNKRNRKQRRRKRRRRYATIQIFLDIFLRK